MDIHILLIDDDTFFLESLIEYLEIVGYKISAVASAEAAFDLLQKDGFELVIVDIALPGISGLEFTERIKKERDIDVILMTGHHSDHSYETAIHSGASDFIVKPFRFEELLLRIKRVLREHEANRERDRIMKKLKKLATTDSLTKLYNSRQFYRQLRLEMDRTCRYARDLSLLFIDIDNFKIYNDNFGHLEGDKALSRMGDVIRSSLRTMDTAYRYGGEEFVVILPETNADEAQIVAERIRSAVEAEVFVVEPETMGKITVSIGVTDYRIQEPIAEFIKRSDRAMYDAKERGRNRTTVFNGPSPDQNQCRR